MLPHLRKQQPQWRENENEWDEFKVKKNVVVDLGILAHDHHPCCCPKPSLGEGRGKQSSALVSWTPASCALRPQILMESSAYSRCEMATGPDRGASRQCLSFPQLRSSAFRKCPWSCSPVPCVEIMHQGCFWGEWTTAASNWKSKEQIEPGRGPTQERSKEVRFQNEISHSWSIAPKSWKC